MGEYGKSYYSNNARKIICTYFFYKKLNRDVNKPWTFSDVVGYMANGKIKTIGYFVRWMSEKVIFNNSPELVIVLFFDIKGFKVWWQG